ncbi:ribokinase [Streptomyces sp. SL13]|uniref:Ribokinase n=1 Tax=Streptantibioticus silvisoli TaxID=2705255 RepID=A0AA90H890_9ACTN|nr:ribokinase [Streptantibioticus silvisoli]MDI5972334.1 ribokinase [Streptantibioticus silvisoli]
MNTGETPPERPARPAAPRPPASRSDTPRPVVVFGSLNRDIRLAAERIARPGETVGGAELTSRWGGKGANQAVAAARLGGGPVLFVGAVGDDATGREALAALDADGVDRRHVAVVPGTPTGTAVVIVEDAGDNAITVAPGANATVRAAQLAPVLAEREPGVLVACFEVPLDEVRAAARLAADAGWQVIVNPAPATARLTGSWPDGCLFTPNAHELAALTGGSADAPGIGARRLAADLRGTVVATLGGDGALVAGHREDGADRVAAPRVAVRDTTGAGDAFNGTLAWCLARDTELVEAARVAVAAASASTEHEGAREGMVDLATLTRLAGLPTND